MPKIDLVHTIKNRALTRFLLAGVTVLETAALAVFAICEYCGRVMKGQDLLVLLKLAVAEDDWSYARLARELKMSASEVHAAIRRCLASGLYNPLSKRPNLIALEEFLRHGLRYVFPAQPGEVKQGLPTSYAAEPLRSRILFSESKAPVMPFAQGPSQGPGIEPLYRSAPQAAANDPDLYRLLALTDALRSGRVRERKIAADLLAGELRKVRA